MDLKDHDVAPMRFSPGVTGPRRLQPLAMQHRLFTFGLRAEIAERVAKSLRDKGHHAVGLAATNDAAFDAEAKRQLGSEPWTGVIFGAGANRRMS